MKNTLFILIVLFILNACDSDDPYTGIKKNDKQAENTTLTESNEIISTTIHGVVDGYIKNATVCIAQNESSSCPYSESPIKTNNKGEFTLEFKAKVNTSHIILATGGINTATNKRFNGTYRRIIKVVNDKQRAIQSLNITPITTLVAHVYNREVEKNPSYSIDDAKSMVATSQEKDLVKAQQKVQITTNIIVTKVGVDSVPSTSSSEEGPPTPIPTIIIDSSIALQEGATQTYNIKLSTKPSSNVVVTLSSPDTGAVTVASTNDGNNTLTFSDSNWSEAQSITLTGIRDDDFNNESVIISHSASGGGYDTVNANITVSITDLGKAKLLLSKTNFIVTEGELDTTSLSIKLSEKPQADTVVTILSQDIQAVTVTRRDGGGNTLTFSDSNWDTEQYLSITGVEDSDLNDESVIVNCITGNTQPYNGVDKNITIEITDNDTASLILSKSALTTIEGGTSTYGIKLSHKPSDDVKVSISNSNTLKATITLVGSEADTLTFTTTNWSSEQFITVVSIQDNDLVNGNATITHTAGYTGGYSGQSANIDINISDEDIGELVLSTTTIINISEGLTGSYTMKLSHKPSDDVIVTVSSSNTTKATVASSVTGGNILTFTPINWNIEQSVIISGVEDSDFDDDDIIIANAIGNTGGYSNSIASINATIIDNDVSAGGSIIVTTTSLDIDEKTKKDNKHDDYGWYMLKLSKKPTADVVVTITSSNPSYVTAILSDGIEAVNQITFSPSNYDDGRWVKVSALKDNDLTPTKYATITNTTGSSGGYHKQSTTVSVKISNKDGINLNLSHTAIHLESLSKDYTVKLSSKPLSDVTVTITNPKKSSIIVASTIGEAKTLTFTPSNWNIKQSVNINIFDDSQINAGGGIYIKHRASIEGYPDLEAKLKVTVNIDKLNKMQVGSIVTDKKQTKYFKYYVPDNVSASDTSLLFYFHGTLRPGQKGTYTINTALRYNRNNIFSKLAKRENIITVYPMGETSRFNSKSTRIGWGVVYGYDKDVPFFDKIVEYFKKRFTNINPKKIYVTGLSSGAIFSFKLAGERASVIAAVAPMSGQMRLRNTDAFLNDGISIPIRAYNGKHDSVVKASAAFANIEKWHEKENKGDKTNIETYTTSIGYYTNIEVTKFLGGLSNIEFYLLDARHGISQDTIGNSIWEFFENHPKK